MTDDDENEAAVQRLFVVLFGLNRVESLVGGTWGSRFEERSERDNMFIWICLIARLSQVQPGANAVGIHTASCCVSWMKMSVSGGRFNGVRRLGGQTGASRSEAGRQAGLPWVLEIFSLIICQLLSGLVKSLLGF